MSGIVISSLLKWKWKHLLARDIVIVPSGDCLEGILVFAEGSGRWYGLDDLSHTKPMAEAVFKQRWLISWPIAGLPSVCPLGTLKRRESSLPLQE